MARDDSPPPYDPDEDGPEAQFFRKQDATERLWQARCYQAVERLLLSLHPGMTTWILFSYAEQRTFVLKRR